jgi:hypothetical protein
LEAEELKTNFSYYPNKFTRIIIKVFWSNDLNTDFNYVESQIFG